MPDTVNATWPLTVVRTRLLHLIRNNAADLAQRRRGRFNFFATLTLPDVEGSLAELAYATDELHAAGGILLANSRGKYLGDPTFEPLLAELDRRGVPVFVHPAQLPGPPADGIPPYIANFLLDTTRAAVNLVRSDAIRRYPAIVARRRFRALRRSPAGNDDDLRFRPNS